jgi:predicted NUDIX family NTP pyrophosphohydrolase
MTTITVVTFEPETIGVYIDGTLHDLGETYMEGRILRQIIESERNIDTTETEHAYFEQWEGVPNELEEVEEIYETE